MSYTHNIGQWNYNRCNQSASIERFCKPGWTRVHSSTTITFHQYSIHHQTSIPSFKQTATSVCWVMRTLYNLVKRVSNYGLTYLYFYTMMHWFDIQLHSDTQPTSTPKSWKDLDCSVALTVTTEHVQSYYNYTMYNYLTKIFLSPQLKRHLRSGTIFFSGWLNIKAFPAASGFDLGYPCSWSCSSVIRYDCSFLYSVAPGAK